MELSRQMLLLTAGKLRKLFFTYYYGLNFINKNGAVSSLFLVGKNGAGKSTAYTALEKIYVGHSSYADLMSKNENDYLTFAFGQAYSTSEKNWALHYDLMGEDHVTLDKVVIDSHPLSVPAFFCSDLDVQSMRKDKNLFHWVLQQMGYGHLQMCLQNVSGLLTKMRSKRDKLIQNSFLSPEDYTEILTALLEYNPKKHDKEILTYSKELVVDTTVPHLLFKKKWEELEKLQAVAHESILERVGNKTSIQTASSGKITLSKLYYRLFLAVKAYKNNGSKIDEILLLGKERETAIHELEQVGDNLDMKDVVAQISYLETTAEILVKVQRQLVAEFIKEYATDIQNILSEFSGHGEEFKFESLGGVENLALQILVKFKGIYQSSPHEYFNEFRFKLYCITMKVAIAYDWMLKNKMAMPIVVDDVFNANDFDNSIRLEQYAYFLKKTYNDKVLSKKFAYNLQLILLTHDQLVLDSFRRGFAGLKLTDAGTMQMDRFPFKAGVIYRLEEIDEYNRLVGNNEAQTFSIYQDENKEQ